MPCTPIPHAPKQVRSASGVPLYLIEYTVGAEGVGVAAPGAPGAPEPVHALCALAAGGARAEQLFTLTYRAPERRWATSEADARQTIASFEVSV